MAKQKAERVFTPITPEAASKKVMELVEMWFKLKLEFKETSAAYKEKIKEIESEIEATLVDAETTKQEAKIKAGN